MEISTISDSEDGCAADIYRYNSYVDLLKFSHKTKYSEFENHCLIPLEKRPKIDWGSILALMAFWGVNAAFLARIFDSKSLENLFNCAYRFVNEHFLGFLLKQGGWKILQDNYENVEHKKKKDFQEDINKYRI